MLPTPAIPAPVPAGSRWGAGHIRALTLLALALSVTLRAIVLLRGESSGESLTSVGAVAAGTSPLSASFLERLLASGATLVGPLEYWPLATALLVLWVGYCGAAWLVCRALVDPGWSRVVLLLFAVFSPMTLSGMSVWPTGVSMATLAIGILLVIHGGVGLSRTGRLRDAWGIPLGALVALAGAPAAAWSPALIVPAWALVLIFVPRSAGLRRRDHDAGPRVAPRFAVASVLLVLAAGWILVVPGTVVAALPRDLGPVAGFIGTSLGSGALPALAGGPLTWAPALGALPVSDPGAVIVVIGIEILLAGAASAAVLAPRGLTIWGVGVGFAVACVALFALSIQERAAGSGGQLLSLAPIPAVMLLAAATSLTRPWQIRRLPWLKGSIPALVGFLAVDTLLALSVVSTIAWSDARGRYSGQEYVDTAAQSMAAADPGIPLLPQVVPFDVADPRLAPLNRSDIIFAPATPRPDFATWTTELQAFDAEGSLQRATLEGIDVPVTCTTWSPILTLPQPLPEFTYVVALTFGQPPADGFAIQLGDGTQALVPGGIERQSIYVQLNGAGTSISLTPLGAEGLCPQTVRIGQIQIPEEEAIRS